MKKTLVTRGSVERALGISGTRVVQLINEGVLHAERTANGLRLFDLAEVEAVARQRAARNGRHAGAAS